MARSDLGELVVHFRAENADLEKKVAALEKSLSRAERTSDRSAQKVVGSLGRMAVGLVSVTAAVAAFTRALDDTRAMDRLATATGTPIEQLSTLRTVAMQNGVTFQELEQVLGQFSNRLREFVANPTSAGAQALRLLGVSARDANGNLRTFEEMLPELANRFASYADGANKAALSSALFGEQGGPAMVRFLNQGADAIAAHRAELERTGRVMDREAIEKSREYERVTAQLNVTFQELARNLTLHIAPIVTKVAGEINKFFDNVRSIQAASAAIQEWDRQNGTAYTNLQGHLQRSQEALRDYEAARANAIKAKRPTGPIDGIIAGLTEEVAEYGKRLAEMDATRRQILSGIVGNPLPPMQSAVGKVGALSDAPNLGAQQEAVRLMNEQLQLMNDKLNGVPLAFQTAFSDTAWAPAYVEAINTITRATELGAITAQRAAQMRSQVQRQEQDAILGTVSAAADAVQAIFKNSKGANIAAAIMNTGVAVTRALASGPPPWNFAQAALVAAAGAAQLASIKSTTKDGGGSLAGGSSGGGGAAAAPTDGLNNTLTVQGLGTADFIRGDTLRELLDAIADKQRDGFKVVVAPR